MTTREVLEQFRPGHTNHPMVGRHVESACDACRFDKAVNNLLQETMLASMAHEREECVKIVAAKIEDTDHWTLWARFYLEDVVQKIMARGT